MPKGAVIETEIMWDNSAENPRNPNNPPVRVLWGEVSTDEMGAVNFRVLAARKKTRRDCKTQSEPRTGNGLKVPTARRQNRLGAHRAARAAVLEGVAAEEAEGQGSRIGKATAEPEGHRRKTYTPLAIGNAKANVLFFTTTDCPIANSYWPEIASIVKDYGGSSVQFFAVHVDPDLNADEARKHAQEFSLTLPVLVDAKHELVSAAAHHTHSGSGCFHS